jgi:hypothetical protein
MDNGSLKITRNEPFWKPAQIPGRQDNCPAAQSRFREISRLAIGKKERKEIHPPISGR